MQGNVSEVRNQHYDAATNTTTAEFTALPVAGQQNLTIVITGTTGGFKNLRVIRPGYPVDTRQVFSNEFLEAMKPFSCIRAMDLMETNYNTDEILEFTDFKPVGYATQAGRDYVSYLGCSLDMLTRLANDTRTDLWICLPIRASDDCVAKMARFFKDSLDPALNLYVEYGNELWNGAFYACGANRDLAVGEISQYRYNYESGSEYDYARRRQARKAVEAGRIFRQVWGADSARVRPVLTWQSVGPGLEDMLKYINTVYGAPSKEVYGIAHAPYMQNTDNVGSVDACLAGLRSYTDDVNRTQAGAVSTVAKRYGVHFMAYEGGPHLCQENNVEIKAAANRDPRMGDLVYHDLKENWFAQGGELYAYFNLCSGYNKYGYWGLTETLNDLTTPKYQAILDLADELEPTESGVAVRHPAVRTIVKPAANAPVRTSERFLPTGRRLHAPGSGPVHPVADGLYLDGHGGTCLVR